MLDLVDRLEAAEAGLGGRVTGYLPSPVNNLRSKVRWQQRRNLGPCTTAVGGRRVSEVYIVIIG